MKITTLIENLVYENGLVSEHGLAIHIDTGESKILFDTGQSDAFMNNAEKLGVDIKEVDSVVISHGHLDHTGGLYAFLKKNKKAKVFLKKEIFLKKYEPEDEFIGTPYKEAYLKDRVAYVEDITEIAKDVYVVPDITITDKSDTSFEDFYVKLEDGSHEEDKFDDELFIAIVKDGKLSVLSSCSHRGITNITRTAIKQFGLPANLIMGGFHLRDSSQERYSVIAEYFREIEPAHIGVCHCTGVVRYSDLKNDFKEKVFYNMTGNTVEI